MTPLRKALSRYISRRELNSVLAKCRGKCVYYGCDQSLVFDDSSGLSSWLGEFAHIYAVSDNGPLQPPKNRRRWVIKNSATNIVLFCPTHHALVDKKLATGQWNEGNLRRCIEEHISFQARLDANPFQRPGSKIGLSRLRTIESQYDCNLGQHLTIDRYHAWLPVSSIAGPWLASSVRLCRDIGHFDEESAGFLLRMATDFARFLRLSDQTSEAQSLASACLGLHGDLFRGPSSQSQEARYTQSLLIHIKDGPETGNRGQIEYCQSEYGNAHSYSINALLCGACVRLNNCHSLKELEAARNLVDRAEGLETNESSNAQTQARILFYRGRISMIQGQFVSTSSRRRAGSRAFEYFKRAEHVFKMAHNTLMIAVLQFHLHASLVMMRDERYCRDEEAARQSAALAVLAIPFAWSCHCELKRARPALQI